MERWYYFYSGLRVVSEMALPEWATFEAAQLFGETEDGVRGADVDIRQADVHIRLAHQRPSDDWPIIANDQFCFHVPETGSYTVRAGREILVTPAPQAGANEVRLFLLGSAWGALCYQRGLLVLHASVVQVDNHAVAFCGASGAGKSSVAAWLMQQGYLLVSDDLCCFDLPADGPPRVYPSAPRLKLWREALDALNWDAPELVPDHVRQDKFHLLNLPGVRKPERVEPLRLRAIYLLEWGEQANLARLSGALSLRRLVAAATYRGELLEPMGLAAAHWQRCATLAQRTPVWQFTRPRDWAAMDAAMALLTATWDKIQ